MKVRLRFPVLWITVLAFACVAVASMNVRVGGLVLVGALPVVLGCQWLVRRVMVSLRYPVWFRRSVMLVPALVVASVLGFLASLMSFSVRDTPSAYFAVRRALAWNAPEGMRELRVKEDKQSGYGVRAYFQCDPASLRGILEKPPFERVFSGAGTFSFRTTPFTDLYWRADMNRIAMYRRKDLTEVNGGCVVYTDVKFSFAYVEYAGK